MVFLVAPVQVQHQHTAQVAVAAQALPDNPEQLLEEATEELVAKVVLLELVLIMPEVVVVAAINRGTKLELAG
jgi:hypothetical protein